MRHAIDAARFAAAVYDVPGQAAWRVRVGGRYVLAATDSDVDDLVDAHAVVVEEHAELSDVRLVIVGRTVGPVSDADLPALVAGASAYAHLPVDEASPAPALEALAAGVPVVARDLPDLRAVLHDVVAYGDTVLSIADALVDVLTDPPEPDAGVALAATFASEHGVVQEQPDGGDGREE